MQAEVTGLPSRPRPMTRSSGPASSNAFPDGGSSTLSGGGCTGTIVSVGSGPASAHCGLGASMPSVRDAARTTRSCNLGR